MTWKRSLVSAIVVAAALAVQLQARAAQPPLTAVTCTSVVTKSIRVANSLWNCDDDGLRVGASNITIDLNGHTIDGDDGSSIISTVGIVNSSGHSNVTVKNGTVSGFDNGVIVTGPPDTDPDNTTITRLQVKDNLQTGITINTGTGNRVVGNTVLGNASNGIYIAATDAVVARNLVRGSNAAIQATADRARILSNTVEHNFIGIAATGADSTLRGNRSSFNTNDGYRLGSDGLRVERNSAKGNGKHGFKIGSGINDVVFLANTAEGNAEFGFTRDGGSTVPGLRFSRNRASHNGLNGFEIDGDGTRFSGDRASSNARYGFLLDGSDIVLTGVMASDNGYDGIWLRTGTEPVVTRSTANRNGFFNGIDDAEGLGIRIDASAPSASRNRARGNDDDTMECTANAACS